MGKSHSSVAAATPTPTLMTKTYYWVEKGDDAAWKCHQYEVPYLIPIAYLKSFINSDIQDGNCNTVPGPYGTTGSMSDQMWEKTEVIQYLTKNYDVKVSLLAFKE